MTDLELQHLRDMAREAIETADAYERQIFDLSSTAPSRAPLLKAKDDAARAYAFMASPQTVLALVERLMEAEYRLKGLEK